MRNLLSAVVLLYLFFPISLFAQHNNFELSTSINEDGTEPDSSAILDLNSTDKGLLIPRMPFCDIEAIENPAEGLMVFDTEFKCLRIYIQNNWQCLYNGSGSSYPLTGWSNSPIDEGYDTDLDLDSEENVYVTTSTEDGEGRLIKWDSKGNELWQILEENSTLMYQVEVDQNDFVFAVGSTSSGTFNGTSVPEPGAFLSKTTPDGSNSQVIVIDNFGRDALLKIDDNDNLITSSIARPSSSDSTELTVSKYSNSLNQLWEQKIELISDRDWHNVNDELTLHIDENNDIYVTGYHSGGFFNPIPDNDPIGDYNIFVAKFSSQTGDLIWSRNIDSDVSILVDNIHVSSNDILEVFGSTDLDYTGRKGSNYYIQRFQSSNGSVEYAPQSSNFDNSWEVLGTGYSESRDEIVFSILDFTNDVIENQIRFYSTQTRAFKDNKDITFGGGQMVYNTSADFIYGIGGGTEVGSTIIEHQDREQTIVYKIQRN